MTLLMAVHCHQPVGNFGFVLDAAYERAYQPFLEVLERHPHVRLSLHYSGCLLEWLMAKRPVFLRRLRALAARGQIELLASGYYEPILPLIPEADRQRQIAKMRAVLRRQCGVNARGLWLAERVWEPDLPLTLERAGIRYTILDANQFAAATPWLPSELQVREGPFWDLLGSYMSEYAGASVRLFPASKRLRYWLPFQPVEQTMAFLKTLQRRAPAVITFADDGEKFGLWPSTHRWVYEEGWLEQFFTAVERERDWLATGTFHDTVTQEHPNGRVALPCGSYEEMLEWSGGYFRNFFTKYPEANAMLQKMLRISRTLASVRSGSDARVRPQALRQAEEALSIAQCNCAYWHGVFGGLYLSHLRRAVYAHLIAAEGSLQRLTRAGPSLETTDLDGDGRKEVQARTPAMAVIVDPDEGGTLTEWSVTASRLNLLDTLSRRPEPYHEKVAPPPVCRPEGPNGPPPADRTGGGAGSPLSIHDLVGVKEDNLASRLIYDTHRRSGFLDYGLEGLPTLSEVVQGTWRERQRWAGGAFRVESLIVPTRAIASPVGVVMARSQDQGMIRKAVRVHRATAVLECDVELRDLTVPVVGVEFNLSLRDPRYVQETGQEAEARAFHVEEPGTGIVLDLAMDPPALVMHAPIETVSESEEGLERTYQGLCVLCLWSLPLPRASREAWKARVRWVVEERPPHRGPPALWA